MSLSLIASNTATTEMEPYTGLTLSASFTGNGMKIREAKIPFDATHEWDVEATLKILQSSTVLATGTPANLSNGVWTFTFTGSNQIQVAQGQTYTIQLYFDRAQATQWGGQCEVGVSGSEVLAYELWGEASQFTLSYNGNTNTGGSAPSSVQVNAGASTTVANQGTLVKTNWNFKGWNTASNGSGTAYAVGAPITLNSNVTLYAQWAETFTVTYNGNGHTGGSVPTNNNRYESGQTFTAATQGTMVKSGSTFQRWNTNSSGTGTNYNANASVTMGSSNMTLYAVWQQNQVTQYTVTFNANGASGTKPPDQTGNSGTIITLPGQGSMTYTNRNFKGWATSSGGSVAYAAGANYTLTSNATLYAVWAQTYTVTYNGNGHTSGTAPTNSNRYEQNQTFTAATKGTLAKTGYTFQNWNTNSAGTGTNYNENATVTMGSSNMTLYAVWVSAVEKMWGSGFGTTNLTASGGQEQIYAYFRPKQNMIIKDIAVFFEARNGVSDINIDISTGSTGVASWSNIPNASIIVGAPLILTLSSPKILNANTNYTLCLNRNSVNSPSAPPANFHTLNAVTASSTSQDFGDFTLNGYSSIKVYGGSPVVQTGKVLGFWFNYVPEYTITYNGNGHTGGSAPSSQTELSGTIVNVKDRGTLVRTNYTFVKWNTASNGSGTDYLEGAPLTLTNDVTLYAIWEENPKGTITYNANTGSGVPPSPQTDYIGNSITVSNQGGMYKTNWTFVKWNTQPDGLGDDYAPNDPLTITGNITLYAIWSENQKYTLSYNGNGHTGGSVPSPQTDYVNSTLTVASKGSLVKTNHNFKHWNTQFDGSGTTYLENASLTLLDDVVLYAIWAPTFSVTYNGNGHTGGSVPINSNRYEQGQTFTAAAKGTLVRANHDFVCWNTQADGNGTNYNENATVTVGNNDIILYAVWQEHQKYTLSYDGNGNTGGSAPSPQTDYINTVVTVQNQGTLVKSNWTFKNWNTQADGLGTDYAVGSNYTLTTNLKLYAIWQENPKYTVSYNGNGHTSGTVPSAQTDYVGTQVYVQGHGDLEKSGYHFAHWNTQADDSGTRYDHGNIITLSANVTLYAQWTNIPTYTVIYAPGLYGTFEPQETNDLLIGDPTPTPPIITGQLGYSFSHWSPTPSPTVTGNATYTAQWTQDKYTVTFSPGTQGTFTQQVTSNLVYGDPTPSAPTVTGNLGYTFTGWSPTPTLTVTGTVEYVAQWVQDKYTVVYHPGTQGTWSAASQTTTNLTYGTATPAFTGNTATDHNPGYTFSHWQPSIASTVTGNATYTAQWTQDKYTVTYAPGSQGTFSPQITQNLVYGDPTPSPPTPTCNPGWAFDVWSPVPSSTVTGNATYTAQWIQLKYTVTYDPGDHGDFTAQTTTNLVYGDPTPKAPEPIAEVGWVFDGWFPVPSSTVTANAVYVAQWVQELYTVTFSPGLHGVFPAQVTSGLVYGDPTPEPPMPTPAFGYLFAYWSPVVASTVTKSVTYTAIWNVILYYVTYDGNGANTGIPPIDTTPYSVENPYATVKGSGSLQKQKSDFDGWSINPYDEKGVYKQGNTIHITSNTTLYAIWVKRNMITQPNDCRWIWEEIRCAKREAGIPLNKNPYDP